MGGDDERTKPAAATASTTPSSAPPSTRTTTSSMDQRMESLGWLTESTVMPKRHKAIEGVGAASIVELKAQLYRTQEQARKDKAGLDSSQEFHRAKKIVLPPDRYSAKNSGVDSRARKYIAYAEVVPQIGSQIPTPNFQSATRDKLELKAENDGTRSYAALEKKAELYDKLARGEAPDEEEKEKYCVDFFRKSLSQDECDQPAERQDARDAQGNEDGENDDSMEQNSKPSGPGRAGVTVDRDEHKQFVREVHEEANQARHKVTTAKLRRQEQEAARREKLRHAYLRKQLEKLTASKKAAETTSSSADTAKF